MTTIKIPVSAGELLDKITILELKLRYMKNPEKLRSVISELRTMEDIYRKLLKESTKVFNQLESLKSRIYTINRTLWKTEDKIRTLEAKGIFDKEFVKLARTVYMKNDERSAVKNEINVLLGSKISEIKEYKKY